VDAGYELRVAGYGLRVASCGQKWHRAERIGHGGFSRTILSRNICLLTSILGLLVFGCGVRDDWNSEVGMRNAERGSGLRTESY